MHFKPFITVCAFGLLCFSNAGLSAQDKICAAKDDNQFGDYTLKYGYTYFSPSGRSVPNGGAGALQKLPGEAKFWFACNIDFFVRSDTIRSSHSTGSWVTSAGDTFVGLDLVLRKDITIPKTKFTLSEIDFTYDAKLPTSTGFAAGEVDHEVVVAFLKTLNPTHAVELDLGDYIEGFSGAPAAHSFELTFNDEIQLGKKWSVVPEFDLTTASPDTPTEAFEVFKFKYTFKDNFVLSPGFRITDTPYTGRFSAFVSLKYSGTLRKKHANP